MINRRYKSKNKYDFCPETTNHDKGICVYVCGALQIKMRWLHLIKTTEIDDILFIDGLFQHLINSNKEELISATKEILEIEEYDTDSLEIDILLFEKYAHCNINKLINNNSHFALIFEFVYDHKCMLFSIFTEQALTHYIINSERIYICLWISFFLLGLL